MTGFRADVDRRAFLRTVGVAVLGCASLPAACAARADADQPLMPSVAWQASFDALPAAEVDRFDRLSRSSDSQGYYQLAYGVDAYSMMFEAMKDQRYLGIAMRLVENMVDSAAPAASFASSPYDDDFLTWISSAPEVAGQEVPLYESYVWRYVFRMLRVLRSRPEIYADPAWRSRYDRILAFGERNVFDKWYTRGASENIFRSRTHMASHWAYIGADLGQITGDPGRREICDKIKSAIDRQLPNYPSSLRGQLTVESDAYEWSDEWGATTPSQDVSHGNNVISYVVEAEELGQDWTVDDLSLFLGTLKVMWPQDGVVSEYVDGTGRGDGWLSDGFVKLGRYDRAVQVRLQRHPVRDPQFLAAMALNAQKLAP